jgi:hypothetical protein
MENFKTFNLKKKKFLLMNITLMGANLGECAMMFIVANVKE